MTPQKYGLRWVVPSPSVLQRIQSDRETLKKALGGSRDRESLGLGEELPIYVCIMSDSYFKGKLDLVTKECWRRESVGPPVPLSLYGLKLPETYEMFIIHRMSRTAASRYGLKLQPRRRRRRRKSCLEPMDTENVQSTNEEERNSSVLSSEMSSMDQHLLSMPMPEWSSYCNNTLLNSNRILYHKVTVERFSRESYLYPILMGVSSTTGSGSSELRHDILRLPVHDIPLTANNTNQFLMDMIESTVSAGKLDNMTTILSSVIKFHSKIRYLSGFIKVCTSKWIPLSNSSELIPSKGTLDSSMNDSSESTKRRLAERKGISRGLLRSVPHSAVLGGMSDLLRISGCRRLLGSNRNRRKFMAFLKKFLMAGIKSELKLGHLMSLLNADECQWLDAVTDPTLKAHIFAKTMYWLFSDYVLNLMKMGFYITEAENTRLRLNFYFHDTWSGVSTLVTSRLLREGKLKKIHRLGQEILQPTAVLRFVPKKDDLRPILGIGLNRRFKKADLNNMTLLINHLTRVIAPHGGISQIFIRNRWKKFLGECVEMQHGFPKLFYLRMDIRNAFPSVNTTKLLEILTEVVDLNKKYVVQEVCIGNPIRKRFSVLRVAGESNDVWQQPPPHCHKSRRTRERRFLLVTVLNMLKKIIRSSEVVKIRKALYHFSDGLPQGSPISQGLCNIYYGHMERLYFSEFLAMPGEFFCRSVDDYFFVSPDPNRVHRLYSRMREGIPDYNCYLKNEKSETNIFVSSKMEIFREEWVLFCGWRFSVSSGHVSRNFGPYAGLDSCSTLSFCLAKTTSSEDFITKRLKILTPLRLCPLILDPSLNCKWRIAKTIFEASMMMAFRFCAATRIVYQNIKEIDVLSVATSLCDAISNFANLTYASVARCAAEGGVPLTKCACMETPYRAGLASSTKVPVTQFEVRYIVYRAFLMKFLQSPNRSYGQLVEKLRKLIQGSEHMLRRREYKYLRLLIGDEMPFYFQKMKA